MTKPSRWAHTYWSSMRGGEKVNLHHTKDRYYRRLCAYYINEARRWRKIAVEEAWLHEIHHADEFADDTFHARMAIAEEFMRDMGGKR